MKRMKLSFVTTYALLLLTACGQAPTTQIDPNTGNTGTTSSTSNTTVDVKNVGQLKFSKVSEKDAAQYNGLIGQNMAQATSAQSSGSGGAPAADSAAAPMAPNVAARSDLAVGASAKMAYPMMYFPNPGAFEEYTVVDFQEAKTNGFSGTYLEALNKIVKPIVLALGSDARLVSSNGNSDSNGVNVANDPVPANGQNSAAIYPAYNQYQWQFSYASASRKEVYSIFVSTQETLVLKQQWGLKDLTPDSIKIDSKEAISIVTKAILDKNYTSPDANQNPSYLGPQAEFLYEIPKNSIWNLYLEKEKGSLIWNINLNVNYYGGYYGGGGVVAYDAVAPTVVAGSTSAGSSGSGTASSGGSAPSTTPAQPPVPEYWYSGGYARIDAATGTILTLSRPTRYRNVVQPYPVPYAVDAPQPANQPTTVETPPCCKQ